MRKLLILFLVFLTLIIYFSSIIVLSLPSHNIPYDVRTLYNEATSLRANVLRIMEINKEKGLLFYDIEQMFKIADKYYQRGISALSQNKYYLAKFSFLKAINYYYVVEDMCAQIQKQAVFCTLVVLLIIIFASFALAGLLVEESLIKRFVVSACFFTISLIILYNFHPGFAIILPPNDPIFWRKIIFYSTTFIVLFYLFFIEFPRNLAPKPTPEKTHFWGAAAMAFHIAYNSLRRRVLRTILTLLTITLTVTSFTAFLTVVPGITTTISLIGRRTNAVTPVFGVESLNYLTPDYLTLYKELLNRTDEIVLLKSIPTKSPIDSNGWSYHYKLIFKHYIIPIYGILGIIPNLESKIIPIKDAIIAGSLISNESSILISKTLSEKYGISIGDSVVLMNILNGRCAILKVVGIFSDSKLANYYDVSGQPYLPHAYKMTDQGPVRMVCPASQVIIMNYKTAKELGAFIFRVAFIERSYDSALKGAETIAEYIDYGAFVAYHNTAFYVTKGKGIVLTGTSTIILIIICYLIIINAMLASIYERRREFSIYSALGFNPSHIKYLLMTEALVLGLLGGGLGYVFGISFSNIVVRYGIIKGLKMNISPTWAVIALVLSIVLTLISTLYPAEKASLQVVPSLERRWRFVKDIRKLHTEELPARVEYYMIEQFANFIKNRIEAVFPPYALYLRSNVKICHHKDNVYRTIIRVYAEMISEGQCAAYFDIICERKEHDKYYKLKLRIKPLSTLGGKYREFAYIVVDEIRKAILAWQVLYKREKGKHEKKE